MRFLRPSAAAMAVLFMTAGLAVAADTAITVYPNGAAVVADSRQVSLEPGTRTVRLSGFPQTLRPATLWLADEGISLINSRFLMDDSARGALLRAREGETVLLLRADGSGGDVRREAVLLSAEGTPMVRVDGHVEWLGEASPWRIALKDLPESVALDGQLALTLAVEHDQQQLNLIYQMGGLSWSAAYVGRLNLESGTLSLRALAALQNRTGSAWTDVQLALIAGEVNRAGGRVRPVALRMASAAAAESAGMKAESAGSYYRYTLDQLVTLAPGAQRNVTLFANMDIPVEIQYRIAGGWRRGGQGEQRTHAAIRLSFDNQSGKPLPAGVVSVYGTATPPLLLGEDRIANTPTGGEVTITLGRAFDITATRVTVDTEREGKAHEVERQITVHNARDESVQVRVVERVPGDWRVLSATAEYEQVDAHHIAWTLSVPAGGSAELGYRVRYR